MSTLTDNYESEFARYAKAKSEPKTLLLYVLRNNDGFVYCAVAAYSHSEAYQYSLASGSPELIGTAADGIRPGVIT